MGPGGRANSPWPGNETGVAGSDVPAEPESAVWPVAASAGLVDAFSAFLLASVVRRFSTAPCISPDAHRPVSRQSARMPRHGEKNMHLLLMDQLIFSDLVISAYGLSKSPFPFPFPFPFAFPATTAAALASAEAAVLLARDPLAPGLELELEAPFEGSGAGEAVWDEAPLLVSLILVMGFLTAAGGGGGGAPGGKAGAALKVWRKGAGAGADREG